MTEKPSEPSLDAQHEETQASLRKELEQQISAAQAEVASQLSELRQLASLSGDHSMAMALENQLTSLKSLGLSVASATGASLAKLRTDVVVVVASSQAMTQQARVSVEAASAAAAQASYAQATAALDAKVAATFEADRRNNDLAHEVAERAGIDLSSFDRERETIEAQRKEAIRRGDKNAERKADMQLSQNTLGAMQAGADSITDPKERQRYQAAMAEEQSIYELRKAAFEEQLELDGKKGAQQYGVSESETNAYMQGYHQQKLSELEHRRHQDEQTTVMSITSLSVQAEVKRQVMGEVSKSETHPPKPPSSGDMPSSAIDEAVKADGHAQASTTMMSLTMGITLPMRSEIKLSSAEDAHTRIEAPVTKTQQGRSNQTQLG